MNATDFFERRQRDRSYPACSESFWSTVFAFFLLHLAKNGKDSGLQVWQPAAEVGPPWYEPKGNVPKFVPSGLTFDNVAVEPNTVASLWPRIEITLTGISPDLILRFRRPTNDTYALVETKVTTGAHLNSNQLSNYPNLIKRLANGGTDARLFVLKSIGCCPTLYNDAKRLQLDLDDRFGILLWEDVFRAMRRSDFSLPGLDPEILQRYSDASQDCKSW